MVFVVDVDVLQPEKTDKMATTPPSRHGGLGDKAEVSRDD